MFLLHHGLKVLYERQTTVSHPSTDSKRSLLSVSPLLAADGQVSLHQSEINVPYPDRNTEHPYRGLDNAHNSRRLVLNRFRTIAAMSKLSKLVSTLATKLGAPSM